MDLILWRHAEAEEGEVDLDRKLTAKGRRQAAKVAQWLDRQLPDGCRIVVSPARRALETVEPLGRKFRVVDAIGPGASAEDVMRAAGWPEGNETLVVVGHQPTLGEVAARVVTGQPGNWSIRKGGLWWIGGRDREEGNRVVVRAVISADML